MPMDRRMFLQSSVIPAAAAALGVASEGSVSGQQVVQAGPAPPTIIDTNVHLFAWPFRRLKYGATRALVEKLRKHRVSQAWAGSFEAILHKDVDGVNARLAAECAAAGDGLFVPFGTVNPLWPDWEEDLRRCHETHRMPGIRLYPAYHGYTLKDPLFARLLGAAIDRRMIVQIVLEMEDPRVHHPAVIAPTTDALPLVELLRGLPAERARVILLNSASAMNRVAYPKLVSETPVIFDISHIEWNGGVTRQLEGTNPAKVRLPVERLVFGSHAPYFPVEAAVLRCFESALTFEQIKSIMHDNAARMIGGAA